MKIGDKIFCKNACIMIDSGNIATTAGMYYTVVDLAWVDDRPSFIIIDDEGDRHSFNINDNVWFDTLRLERKEKLNNLNQV